MNNPQAFDQTMDRLEQVLAAERQCLAMGQVHVIAELTAEKADAMQALDRLMRERPASSSGPEIGPRLKRIVRAAQENAQHFGAVQQGLRKLTERVSGATQDAYVGAYQANGLQNPFTKATGNYQKKV